MESSKTVVTPHRAVVSHLGRRIDRSSCTRRTDDTIGPYGASMRTSPTDPIAVLLHLTQTLGEDRTLEDALLAVTDAALRALAATVGQEVTYTCMPLGWLR